jgi:AcrR family transcriptional regulator
MDRVEDKRQAILDATLRLISVNGFHGTAMSKVAQEAGVSTGIIYHYFDSKDELIDELYKAIKRKSAQATLENIDREQPVRNQLRQILRNIIRYYVWHPQESAFVEQYVRSPYYHPGIDAEISEVYQPITACFERAKQEMIIKDFPPAVISTLTVDVATSLAQKQAGRQLTLTNKLIEQVIDASWEAIRQ